MALVRHSLTLALCLTAIFRNTAAVGSKCSSSERFTCLGTNSECVDQVCECKPGYVGNPYIACIEDAHTTCSLVNDPRGRTFAGEPELKGIDIPLPCRYIAAHFDAVKISSATGNPLAKCTVRVYTAEERFMGKFYVSGFEAIVDYTLGSTTSHFSFRARAAAVDENYDLFQQTRRSGKGAYTAGDNIDAFDDAVGGTNVFDFDDATKNLRLIIEFCGLHLQFRPADFNGKPQVQQPGMVIGVNEKDFTVDYHSLSSSFCLTSDTHQRSVSTVVELNKMDADHAFTFRAFGANLEQDFPNIATDACIQVGSVVAKNCTDVNKNAHAMTNCGFILSDPRFVSCYGGDDKYSSSAVLDLFAVCMQAYCLEDAQLCQTAQGMVNNHHCRHNADYVFVGFSCEFHPTD